MFSTQLFPPPKTPREKTQKKDPRKLFSRELRVPKRAILCHKKFSLLLQIRPPCTGARNPQIRERALRSRKPPISTHARKGHFESKNLHFYIYRAPQGKWFFDSERPFLAWLEMGVFRLRNALSLILGFLTPLQGGRIRKFSVFCLPSQLGLCCPCPPRGPENPRNSSRSKVGPKVGFFGGSRKVGQKYRNSCTFDLLLTYLQGAKPTFGPTFDFDLAEFLGFSGPLGGQGRHKTWQFRWQ